MTRDSYRTLKENAKKSLQVQPGHKRVFLIYACVLSLAGFLVSLLSYLLQQQATKISGLDGISTHSLLQTLEMMFSLLYNIAAPFWKIGLFFVALQAFRQVAPDKSSLMRGFHYWGPVLRLILMKILMIIIFAMLVGVVCSTIISFVSYTPLAEDMNAYLETLPHMTTQEDIMEILEDPLVVDKLMDAILPILPFAVTAAFAGMCPLGFRLRMIDFAMMDVPGEGPWTALRTSWRITKGNCLALLRLDIGFWWYYLLVGLLTGLSLLCTYLPLDITTMFWVYSGVTVVGEIALYGLAGPQVRTAYAAAYETMKAERPPKENTTVQV